MVYSHLFQCSSSDINYFVYQDNFESIVLSWLDRVDQFRQYISNDNPLFMPLRSGRLLNNDLTMSTEVNQVIMTPEMLQNLLAGVQQAIQGSTTTTTTTVSKDGNFSNCTSRFDGKVNSNVEPFIDSIVVYKDCADISDENALKGLPMLLNEPASTWWQGIKSSITTFEEALLALKHAYGYAKPPHQIYRELFSREQNEDEPTDIFISKCRALLSYLPKSPAVHESTQLHMVYGLLHYRTEVLML
ncbi:hypothetical protein NQ314_018937 [Rhamnusium bicolor]|uniref:Retrotransposon gag domain-containing protein n=1 Tax=Rhamnusium bicolor TaxID=1586634 RepID=A0AAV8WQ88_9CUCU|nr:hypothetical protein NQ314_018937 [Rhamnusium bicolor]